MLRRVKLPNVAAALTVAVVAIILVAPGIFVVQRLVNEACDGLEALSTQIESERWRTTLDHNPRLARVLARVQPHLDVRGVAERAANAAASWLSSFVGGSVWMLTQLLITFLTLFYLYRDGDIILIQVKSLVALARSETDKLCLG
jgi:predicted PurR-regulated permease PerM